MSNSNNTWSQRWLKSALQRLIPHVLAICFITACSGSDSNDTVANQTFNPNTNVTDGNTNTPSVPIWNTPTPDFSDNPDRPVITLIGEATIALKIGDTYVDAGAIATDSQDANLSAQLTVDNTVNTNITGDYFVRYSVTNSNDLSAIEAVRIVRVYDQHPLNQSTRSLGLSGSHLGYLEYLPKNYDNNPAEGFPLIIFHHGAGANANLVGGTADGLLRAIVASGGIPSVLARREWNTDLPFIVLSPQRSNINSVDMARIDAFVEYAKSAYNVDTSRIYMTGWSQGGLVSFLYAVTFPRKVAAIAPIAGGFFGGAPANVCDMSSVPTWAFHGGNDTQVNLNGSGGSIVAVRTINECQPDELARLSVFPGQGHGVHDAVHSLSALGSASDEYTPYNESIYDWFLSHRIDD